MARTLVQALEGISFPCDRTRIVEYARSQDVSSRALEYLEQLPDQQYRNMTELFTALPAKSQRRPKLAVVSRSRPEPAEVRQPEPSLSEASSQQPWQSQPPLWSPLPLMAQWQGLWMHGLETWRRLLFHWAR